MGKDLKNNQNQEDVTNPDLQSFLKEKEAVILIEKDKEELERLQKEKEKHQEEIRKNEETMAAIHRSTRTLIPQFIKLHNYCRMRMSWYYNWHHKPYSSLVHWILLVLYIIGLAFLFVSVLLGGPTHKAGAASQTTWSGTEKWKTWELKNLSVTDDGLKLSEKIAPAENLPPASIQYEAIGTATIAFNPQKDEIEEWLGAEAVKNLNNQSIKIEFSTDNVLWTENATSLSSSSTIYLRLTLKTTDPAVTPVFQSLTLNYSRPPTPPQNLTVAKHFSLLGFNQTLNAGAFNDPDNDSHFASQWQVTDQSGSYIKTLRDSGADQKNLTSYTIKNLKDSDYYFRVRYQDSTGAWSEWSSECNFKIKQSRIEVLSGGTLTSRDTSGVYQTKSGETEIIEDRTETFKKFKQTDNKFRVAGQIGDIHYKLDPDSKTEQFKEIDLSIQSVVGKSWDYAMENNGYQARFYQSQTYGNQALDYVAEYREQSKWLRMAPVELFYENAAGEKQTISQPTKDIAPAINNENYQITWENAFGKGLDFRYNVGTSEFFKTVIIRDQASLPAPTISSEGLKLTVTMSVAWSNETKPDRNFAQNITPNTLSNKTSESINEKLDNPIEFSFKDTNNQDIWWMQEPKAWDSSEERNTIQAQSQLTRQGDKVYNNISVPMLVFSDAQTKFPYYIDTAIAQERVVAGSDDAYENKYGPVVINGTYIYWAYYDPTNYAGARFQGVPIPVNAEIDSATVQILTYSTTYDTIYSTLDFEDGDAATFATVNNSISSRTLSGNGVLWDAADMGIGWHISPDLSTPLEAVTKGGNWVENYNLAVITNDTGSITNCRVRAYESGSTLPPKFDATYTEAPVSNDCSSTQTGNWSDASTWTSCGGTTPQTGDTATINDTHTVTLTGAVDMGTSALTINSGGNLVLAGNNLTSSTSFTNSGTLTLIGNETVSIPGGAPQSIGGTVTYTGNDDAGTNTYYLQNWSYANLTVNSADSTTDIFAMPTANITLSGTLTLTDGAFTTLDSGSASRNLIVGALSIAGGTFTANASAITDSGNWTNAGTIAPGTSTLTMNSSVGGQTLTAGGQSLYNLIVTNTHASGVTFADSLTLAAGGRFTDSTPNSKLTFADGATFNFPLITINGDGTGDVTMTKGAGAHGHWHFIVPGTPTVTYVTVDNSDATGSGAEIDATSNCHDGTGNTYWDFGSVLSISLDVDQDSIAFGGLLPGNVVTGTTITTVNSNYSNGYTLAIQDNVAGSDSVLLHTDTTTRIADYTGTIALPTVWSGTGFGVCVWQADTAPEAKWCADVCTSETDLDNKYAGAEQNTTTIHTKTGTPTTDDKTYVGYKLVVPNTQKTGNYAGTLIYTATGVLL